MEDPRRYRSSGELAVICILEQTDVSVEQYLIRVSVRCPESAQNFVPAYKHVSRIGVATEPWGTRTLAHELLEFRGFSDPAIGMVDARIELRPPSSVAW